MSHFSRVRSFKSNAITVEAMAKLDAKRLLTYYRIMRSRYGIDSWGRCDCCGMANSDDDRADQAAGMWYMREIKKVMDTKPHIEPSKKPKRSGQRFRRV